MLTVSVISAEATLFEGQATAVIAPAFDGEVGILTNHAPMITALGRGTLRVEDGSAAQRFTVAGGFLQVVDNQVRIVTEQASISR
ncbi:MAG TPA: ATP synthase F1 subunit epsilon [Gemmatimonadaceae bacterium]|nr:ATP synthase F1 subunit epsilon [Gemmatimonadaceae bacterium]